MSKTIAERKHICYNIKEIHTVINFGIFLIEGLEVYVYGYL